MTTIYTRLARSTPVASPFSAHCSPIGPATMAYAVLVPPPSTFWVPFQSSSWRYHLCVIADCRRCCPSARPRLTYRPSAPAQCEDSSAVQLLGAASLTHPCTAPPAAAPRRVTDRTSVRWPPMIGSDRHGDYCRRPRRAAINRVRTQRPTQADRAAVTAAATARSLAAAARRDAGSIAAVGRAGWSEVGLSFATAAMGAAGPNSDRGVCAGPKGGRR